MRLHYRITRFCLHTQIDAATKKQKIGRHQCIDEDELEVDENVVGPHLLNDHEEQEHYEQDGDKEDRYMDEQIKDNENIEEDDRESDADVEEPASIPCTPKQLGRPLRWNSSSLLLRIIFPSDRKFSLSCAFFFRPQRSSSPWARTLDGMSQVSISSSNWWSPSMIAHTRSTH